MMKMLAFKLYSELLSVLPRRTAIALEFRRSLGTWPNFGDGSSFNEKIQLRKLKGKDGRYGLLSDKAGVKKFIESSLGDAFVVPTIWVGPTVPEFEVRKTWTYPYVVKPTHLSGEILFIREESDWQTLNAEKVCGRWLKQRFPKYLHERWYDDIKPQIIVEPLLSENINDYKFYVFDGEVRAVHVDMNRGFHHVRSFYDKDWQELPFGLKYPRLSAAIPKPVSFSSMIAAAERLGHCFDFVRIDFYDSLEGPKVGEFTFAPESGFGRFSPPEFDHWLGRHWNV